MISKEAKAAYDREYRKKNATRLKRVKAEYFRRTYDPVKAAIKRKKRMPQHVAYCRTPRYRAWKKEYDRRHRASKFGDFAAAYETLKRLQKEIRRQMPDRFERYAQSGRKQWNPINQEKQRRRRYGRTDSRKFEEFSLVNP